MVIMLRPLNSATLFIQKKWLVLILGFILSAVFTIFIRGTQSLKGVDAKNYVQLFNDAYGLSFMHYFNISSWTGSPAFVTLNYLIYNFITTNPYIYLFLITFSICILTAIAYGCFFKRVDQ